MNNPADEINEMNQVFEDTFEDTPVKEEEQVVEEEVEQPEPEPAEPEPAEPPAEPEPDEKDKLILELRAKLAEKEAPAPTEEPEPPPPEPFTLEEKDFIGDLDVGELIDNNPKEFNKLLNKIYQQAVTDTRKVLGEGVLRSIPDIVKSNLVAMTNLQKASDQFYEKNADLADFKKVVATVFEEKASENPDKSYTELLTEIGPEVRKRLGLKPGGKNPNQSPKLPKKSSRPSRPAERPPMDRLQAEIEEMNKTLLE